MASILKPKRRTTDATAPTTANLADGELAVNSVSRTIFQRVGTDIVPVANYSALALQPSGASQSGIGYNSIAVSGFYRPANDGGEPQAGADADVLHIQASNGDASQLAFVSNSNVSFRVKDDGATWSTWVSLWHSGNFDPTTKLGISSTETLTGTISFSQAIYANAADAQLRFYGGDNTNSTNRNTSVLHNKSSGNLGIYDNRAAAWLLRIDSSNNIYMPSGNKPVESDGGDVLRIRKMTAAAYAALGTKDSNTLYVIVG